MNKLVIIDGHAILHRAYHALPPMTTSKGQIVNAVYGFISMLIRVVSDLSPTHMVVAFDTPEPTFRNKLSKDYQAQRPKADDEFISQIDIVKNAVKDMQIPIFEKAGFEADDIIGTLAYQASGLKIKNQKSKIKNIDEKLKVKDRKLGIDEVIIVTGDKDILQLVDEKVKVYMPVKGLSKSKMWSEKEVEEKLGIKSNQIVDYKALVGDQSDNYKGINGIGPKTAKDLLCRFVTLDNIFKHLEDIEKENLRNKLKNGKKDAQLSKKLATIVTDVSVKLDLESSKLDNLDKPEVHWLLEELEFKSLIRRLKTNNKQPHFAKATLGAGKKTDNKKKEEKKTLDSKKKNGNNQLSLV